MKIAERAGGSFATSIEIDSWIASHWGNWHPSRARDVVGHHENKNQGGQIMNERLEVYHIQNPPNTPTWYPVASPLEAIQKIEELAKKDMEPDSKIWGNVFGLCVLDDDDGERSDWRDDEDDDIDAWAEKHGVTRDHDTE